MTASGPPPTTVLAAVDAVAPPGTPVTTTEVAAEFDCATQTVAETLETLAEEGVLKSKPVADQQTVWWRPASERRRSETTDTSSEELTTPPSQSVVGSDPLIAVLDSVAVGIIILNSSYEVVWLNTAMARYFGLDREAVRGCDKRLLIHDKIRRAVADSERFAETLLATYEDNTFAEQFECRVTAGQRREERWLEHRSTPIVSGVYAGGRIEFYSDITDRKQREQALRHQREQLRELNQINSVIQDITNAVIDQSTREEIERIVCERLADAETYNFAWIGEIDTRSQAIIPRTEAGVEGYLEAAELSASPDVPGGQGPAGTAIRTGTMQVTQDALANPAFEPWHEYADRYGYRSMAAVPISYHGSFYGLLGIYAAQPDAFDDEVRPVIAQLGEIVGHAIAATERKQALMSPELTEIEFLVPGFLSEFGIEMSGDGTITVDRVVAVGDDTFLEYGTVDAVAIETLEQLVEQRPQFEEVTITTPEAEISPFELRLSEPPLVSIVAAYGGYLRELTIEDGGLRLTIHLPPTLPARRIIDAIQSAYPTVKLLTRRQISRSDESVARVRHTLTDSLTDRQQAALETAVYSGFFEWPRTTSGQEIATLLGVAPATFHQHLRTAQKKVFESVVQSTPLGETSR